MATTTSPVTGGSLSTPPATGTIPRITDTDLAALRAMNGPVVSAADGACVCGAEDGLFANPDPSCGVAAHRHPAQTCPTCGGDGCDWHLSPTNGAIEIDGPCPACAGTGRTTR